METLVAQYCKCGCGRKEGRFILGYYIHCYRRIKSHGENIIATCVDCGEEVIPPAGGVKSKRCITCRIKHEKERSYAATRKNSLLKNFGMTQENFEKLLNIQNNKCAICGVNFIGLMDTNRAGYKINIDHDHGSGKVRGILCFLCNLGIANFDESVEIMKSAIEYLNKYKWTKK